MTSLASVRGNIAVENVVEVGSGFRRNGDAYATAFAKPSRGSVARSAFASAAQVIIGANHYGGCFGRENQIFDAGGGESAAQVGIEHATATLSAVSIPSATASRSPSLGAPKRTAPPATGPNIAFGFSMSAVRLPSGFKYVA
jgi:hypothetical protein